MLSTLLDGRVQRTADCLELFQLNGALMVDLPVLDKRLTCCDRPSSPVQLQLRSHGHSGRLQTDPLPSPQAVQRNAALMDRNPLITEYRLHTPEPVLHSTDEDDRCLLGYSNAATIVQLQLRSHGHSGRLQTDPLPSLQAVQRNAALMDRNPLITEYRLHTPEPVLHSTDEDDRCLLGYSNAATIELMNLNSMYIFKY
ncbi:UNVERIFIED_CONTAM: hypothetical protein FKN15_047013 [Acipenser sinensis]